RRTLARVARVEPHAIADQEAAVRHVAEQRVVEAVAGDERIDVMSVGEPRQGAANRRSLATREYRDVRRAEGLADDSCVREERTVVEVELVEARAQCALECDRKLSGRLPCSCELHDEEGIALCASERRLGRSSGAGGQSV